MQICSPQDHQIFKSLHAKVRSERTIGYSLPWCGWSRKLVGPVAAKHVSPANLLPHNSVLNHLSFSSLIFVLHVNKIHVPQIISYHHHKMIAIWFYSNNSSLECVLWNFDTTQQPFIWSMVHHTIYYLNHSIWKWKRCFLNIFFKCDDYFYHSLLPK